MEMIGGSGNWGWSIWKVRYTWSYTCVLINLTWFSIGLMPHTSRTGTARFIPEQWCRCGASAILSLSRNKNLNTSSSIEGELVGLTDALGMMMLTKYFMETQGYAIDSDIIFQDNQFVFLLTKNSRSRTGKKINHIKTNIFLLVIRYNRRTWKLAMSLQVRFWMNINQRTSKEIYSV